ncbi:putative protein kinase [Leptomonas seymouri]|uniref:Protein kinase domain-containing protein n=1 Tax=Leptomonas seymouri TaxID=5684 RepID=A0A0N1IBG9_LEPSE|nr:putative protein kinase [Leptomonas seymouri]|eukprot:KPI90058.1 putative protein kinase [Leptomonas seymouri]
MPGSDHHAVAYLIKESSINAPYAAFTDGTNSGNRTNGNAEIGMNASRHGSTHTEEHSHLSRTTTTGPTNFILDQMPAEEHFLENDLPVTPPGRSSAPPVVDLQEISVADISQMRLEGCRTHRITPVSSYHDILCDALSRTGEMQGGSGNVPLISVRCGRSMQPRSSAHSPGANTLDNSVAILEHVTYDTATRVEGPSRRQTPAGAYPAEGSPSGSPLCAWLVRNRTTVPSTCGMVNVSRGDAADPIVLTGDADSGHPTLQRHRELTGHCRKSPGSSSPLQSLSESELYGARIRHVGTSRDVAAQVLSRLAGQVDDPAATGRPPSSLALRFCEPLDVARRRARLLGTAASGHGESKPSSEALVAPLSTFPPVVQSDRASPITDVSVYNHDFQRIISHEVKEALTRNMRPSVDDDEDEGEVLLNDVLSGQVSPALLPTKRRGSPNMNESHNCSFEPFQLPMETTSIGCLDSIVGTSQPMPGGGTANGFFERSTGRQARSPSTAALEGGRGGASATAQGGNSGIGSPEANAASSRGNKAQCLYTVSSQAWRFPILGKDSSSQSPAQRRSLLEDAEEEEETDRNATATTAAAGVTTGSSRCTPLIALHNSYGSSSGRQAAQGHPRSTGERDAGSGAASPAKTGTKGSSMKPTTVAGGAHSNNGKSSSVGASAGMVRYEGGRLYTQPSISARSSSSLPGSGAVADDTYHRKLEMVYSVYERLLQQRQNVPTPKAMKELVTGKLAAGGAAETSSLTPQEDQLAQQQQRNPGLAGAGAASSLGASSRTKRSPSLSCSGALGRSAGYYSFGTRASLRHPNRQSLPQQYLGSCSMLTHGTPSPRTAVLGSPAVVDLVVGGGSNNGNHLHHSTHTGAAIHPGASGSAFTQPPSSAICTAHRNLNSVLVHHIELRPLLQSTLFLTHTLRYIREAHGDEISPAGTSKDSDTTLQLAFSGVTAVPSGVHDLPKFNESMAANPVATAVGNGHLASMATPLGSAVNAVPEDRELSSRDTREPSSGSCRSPSTREASANRKNAASAGLSDVAIQKSEPKEGAAGVTWQTHADPNNALVVDGAAYPAEVQQPQPFHSSTAARAYAPQKADDAGGTSQRYYRALTEAERRVCHVHSVDGVEREVDNESFDLIVYVGMRLMGWLEVVSLLGCGSFGQVFLCKDLRICDGHFVHPSEIGGVDYEYWNCSHAFLPFSSVDIPPTNSPLVAVKVVKSVPLLEQQSVLEAEMLVLIGAQTTKAAPTLSSESANAPPPEDPRCAYVAKVLADGISYGHHCIVVERYGANLYEYIASNDHLGLPMYQIRSIGQQLFTALSLIHEECNIIHADIKPENMLLTLNSSRGVVRTNEAPAAVTQAAGAGGAAVTHSSEVREQSPNSTPPRHVQRTEESVSASTTCSPERSYITLRTGPAATGRRRVGQLSSRSSAVPLEASTSIMSKSKGHSFCHLRSSVTSRATVVEQATVPAPEPWRVQSLNQSAGMLPSKTSSTTAAASGKPAPVSPPSMVPKLHVKLIDFSSSCYGGGPFYQYIQSRYYRAPEVIVGATYGSGIDIWSSGCLLAELLLGMPLLPGCNDHHQLCLIEEMVAPLPEPMVQEGANSELYYRRARSGEEEAAAVSAATTAAAQPSAAPRPFVLRTREEYLHITQSEPQPYRRYFTHQTLQELLRHCPLTLEERRMSNGLRPYVPANEPSEIPPNARPSPSVRSEMLKQRFLLFDLLRRLLQTDPKLRPTATQVLTHPFFTSAPPYMKTFMLE